MTPFFRPLRALTLAFLPAFAVLIALGVWQLERLAWKEALIARAGRNLAEPPLTLAAALALGPEGAQYRHVVLDGRFDHAKESYVFTTGAEGVPVYHVVTPFVLGAGRVLMVDRGMIPLTLRDPATRRAGQLGGEHRVTGVWRIPDPVGTFTPKPDPIKHVWYARDVEGMAKADGLVLAAPVIVEADVTPNPGGWPKGGQTVVQFRNEHLQYAITWFALAAVLLAVYLAYHRGKGRLGLR